MDPNKLWDDIQQNLYELQKEAPPDMPQEYVTSLIRQDLICGLRNLARWLENGGCVPKREKEKTLITIRSKRTSGGRRSWFKHVTRVDTSKENGYAFEGKFLREGENELPLDAVVVECEPVGSVKHGSKEGHVYIVKENTLELLAGEFDWREEFFSLRYAVVQALAKG